jgi:hypothetical protein
MNLLVDVLRHSQVLVSRFDAEMRNIDRRHRVCRDHLQNLARLHFL